MILNNEPTLHNLDKRLTAHEQVCAERQGSILKRLTRIEGIFYAIFAVLALTQWDKIKAVLAVGGHP